jgi:hypothetical protein
MPGYTLTPGLHGACQGMGENPDFGMFDLKATQFSELNELRFR